MKLLGALLVLLVLASPASADWKQDRALKIAQVVWHEPCVDAAKFVVVDQKTLNADTKLPGGANVAARGDRATCTIKTSDGFTPEKTYWWLWCTIIVHEGGHLAGYHDWANVADPDHSLNPRSVMYWNPNVFDPRCAENGRPFLERAGELLPRLPRHKRLPS